METLLISFDSGVSLPAYLSQIGDIPVTLRREGKEVCLTWVTPAEAFHLLSTRV